MEKKESKVIYYECKSCGYCIPPDTGGVFTTCKCGKMSIDGTEFYTRIVGNMDYVEQVFEKKQLFVYRIRQVKTGKFFVPRSGYVTAHFSETGKFYGRKPSLTWIAPHHGECIIEKYSLTREVQK